MVRIVELRARMRVRPGSPSPARARRQQVHLVRFDFQRIGLPLFPDAPPREVTAGYAKTAALILLRHGGLKFGTPPPVKKGGALPPRFHKSGGKLAADLPRQTVLNVLQNIKTTEYTEYTEGHCTIFGSPRHILQ